ncbi:MAG: GFA family protein [Hyphomicrobiales bacterium]
MGNNGDVHEGGCLCGAVRYAFCGAPTYQGNCHCRSCQRATGASFVTWVGVKPEDLQVTKGEITECETSPGVQRGFCGKCGSSLTYGGDDWTDIGIIAVSLDDPSFVAPESNVYLDHKQPWVIIDDSLRLYDKLP